MYTSPKQPLDLKNQIKFLSLRRAGPILGEWRCGTITLLMPTIFIAVNLNKDHSVGNEI